MAATWVTQPASRAPQAPASAFDEADQLSQHGLSRVIGVELKMRHGETGQLIELGMWVPDGPLLIPNLRNGFGVRPQLAFPHTVHTTHGDLNYRDGGWVG